MNFKHKELLFAPFITLVAACSGDSGIDASEGDGTDGGDTGPTIQLALGELSDVLISGKLTLGLDRLSARGQTPASVSVVNIADSTLYTASTTVSFTSICSQQGLATITSPITTTTGLAQTVYTAAGCEGTDTITASIDSGATALANVTVASAELGALSFSSATPTTIALKNLSSAGLETVAEVKFKLVDKTNTPIKGETINFSLSDAAGGVSLTNRTGITDSAGLAVAFVNSGTVKTTFRVNAVVSSNSALTAVSNNIAIGTGLATQKSLSLSSSTKNPFAWTRDGEQVNITARVSDFYNNPPPDGTKVIFYTSHGQVEPECELTNGACSVIWTSGEPRPRDSDGLSVNGRLMIVGTLKGEEQTGPDLNSNGLFDDDNGESFSSQGEAFVDQNWNGIHDIGEEYIDVDGDQLYSPQVSTAFRGARCTDAARARGHCASLADIFDSVHMVMSAPVYSSTINLSGAALLGDKISIPSGGRASLVLEVADALGNAPGTGSTVTISEKNELEHTITITGGSFEVGGNILLPTSTNLMISLAGDGIEGLAGTITIVVTNPDGSETWPLIFDIIEIAP